MSAIYKSNIQVAKYVKKKGVLFFKSKGYRKMGLKIIPNEFSSVFNDEGVNFPLNQIINELSFDELDYNDYLDFIKNLKDKRKKEKEYGRDFTSQIKLENQKFYNYKTSLFEIKQKHIYKIYTDLYLLFVIDNKNTNEIQIEITNKVNEVLKVSNKYSSVFSLPWSIELREIKTKSYNPKITEYVKTILPPDFNNYDLLLGGELIYELIKEQIIDKIEYKKNGY